MHLSIHACSLLSVLRQDGKELEETKRKLEDLMEEHVALKMRSRGVEDALKRESPPSNSAPLCLSLRGLLIPLTRLCISLRLHRLPTFFCMRIAESQELLKQEQAKTARQQVSDE